MLRTSLLAILLSFLNLCAYSQHITGAEMLGRPTNTGITLEAIFDSVVEARMSYGTTSGSYTDHTAWQLVAPDTVGEAVVVIALTNLTPSTQYYYKLQFRRPSGTTVISRAEHTFHTARPSGESFTFVIEADPHLDASSDTALYRLCLKNQLEDAPDFMIDMGDNFMTDKLNNGQGFVPEDTIPYRCKLLRSFYQSECHSVPLFLVLGNHEGEEGWYLNNSPNNVAVWDTKYRKKYFTNPQPDAFYTGDTTNNNFVGKREAYYAMTWGDALFVVLDPFWNTTPKPDSLTCWRWSLGKPQYDWLKSTLETSTAKFKFVFIHNLVGGDYLGRGGIEKAPYYEWGGKNKDGTDGWATNRHGWYKPIKDLLTENRVTILFHGHDHFYGKQELDCLLYQELPQPSLPNFNGIPQAATYGYVNGVLKPNSGHVRVNVSPTGITLDYVRAALPTQETSSLHNKDITETYHIGLINCYDSTNINVPEQSSNYNIITVYPNPATSNSLIIESNMTKDYNRHTELLTITGEIVTEEELLKGSKQLQMNITDVVSGLYFVKVNDGANSSVFKITIAK